MQSPAVPVQKTCLCCFRQIAVYTCSLMSTSAAKRLRSFSPPQGSPSAKRGPQTLSILSWNVDNPCPYLSSSSSKSSPSSKPISSYFQISAQPAPKVKRKGKAADGPPSSDATPTLREILAAHAFPQICCLQEVRALTKDTEAVCQLRQAANHNRSSAKGPSELFDTEVAQDGVQAGPSYRAYFSLCQSQSGSKRFGVATYVSSDFKHEYTARGVTWDAEGRVMILCVPSLQLSILNIYALNGSEYAWKDPVSGHPRGTRNERKREFNRLLMRECQSLQKIGYRLVMVGDWNISREKRDCFPRLRTEEPHAMARQEFNEIFMPTLGVVDVFREIHGDKRSYSVSLLA